ncbi:MAG: HAMP domain-containing sensor histidine kinase [Asticcacaulis sp.]
MEETSAVMTSPSAPGQTSSPPASAGAGTTRPYTPSQEVVASAFAPVAATPEMGRRTFMRMVSHELRTPLNSIIGFSDILSHELYGPLGSPQYVEYAGIIRDSGRRLLSLFNDVLEIVRLENEPDLLKAEIDDLRPMLEDAVKRHACRAAERGVTLSLDMADDELLACFDPRGLNSSLDHLLVNAIDFTPEGGSVDIRAHAAPDRAEIRIFNPGPAPDPTDIARLMRPFEQGAGDYNRSREGAGLGWTIVRLSMTAMGGDFHIASDPAEGLTATLMLKRD